MPDGLPEKVAYPITKLCYAGPSKRTPGCAFNCAITVGAVLSGQFPVDANGAYIRFSSQGLSVPYDGKRYIYGPPQAVFIMALAHDKDPTLAAEFEFTGELLRVTPIKKATRKRKDRINELRPGQPSSKKKYDRFAAIKRALADGK